MINILLYPKQTEDIAENPEEIAHRTAGKTILIF